MLGAALLAAVGTAQAGEINPSDGTETTSTLAAQATVPAEAHRDMTTWLLLAEVSLTNGNVTALQSCLEQEMVAEVVSSFAQNLAAVVAPAEASQPWLSCGTSGCP
jgi:hypothetical protein